MIPEVSAVSSTIRDSYAPRETMIGEITGGILAPIRAEQVRVVRDGHLDVAAQFDIGKLGNRYFIWIIAPANSGNYSLIIRNVVALVDGVPEVVEYRKDFTVQGPMIDFSVAPGFVIANKNFEIAATAYSGMDVQVDFPESRTITLYPGTNYVDFSISGILGTQQILMNFGRYQIPLYIVGQRYICGDGLISDREVCDGANLDGKTCTSVPGGFISGQLQCASSCLAFDTSFCELPSDSPSSCDSEHLSLCLTQANCTGAGGHWYNNTCNRYEQGAVCDSQHVELCLTQGTCIDAGGYWYNNTCNKNASATCGENYPELCLTAGTCLDAKGYWYNNSCYASAEVVAVCGDGIVTGSEECDGNNLSMGNCTSLGYDGGNLSCMSDECRFNLTECFLIPLPGPPSFALDPAEIRSTVFLSRGFSTYRFRITNTGDSEIVGLRLDFNPSKFMIVPYQDINISVNESASFNVTVNDVWRGHPFKGVVIAYAEDSFEYLLLEFNFTDTESGAITEYSRNSSSSGPSYYCSELLGIECGAGQTCDGNVVATIDRSSCCVGTCSDGGGGGGSWMWVGYLVAGVVLIVVVFVFMKYKKAGKSSGSPLQSKINSARKNLP